MLYVYPTGSVETLKTLLIHQKSVIHSFYLNLEHDRISSGNNPHKQAFWSDTVAR